MDGSTRLDPASSDGIRNMGQAGLSAGAGPVTATNLPAGRDIREAKRRLKEAEALRSKFTRYRANDYAVEESDLRRSLILNTTEGQFRWDKAFSWLLSLIIGVLNGIAGFLFTEGINWLNRAKFQTTLKVIRPHNTGIISYLVYLSFSLLYALAGALLGSYVSPQAAGSGIPEIRCYLNGIHVRGLLTVRTFFAKSFGVVLSVASGLVVGKEGPFTHVGAIIGGGVGHLGSTSLTRATNGHLRAVLHTRFGRYFKSAVSHRDYVAAGAASGVASAFAAPLGGILFSVEQGASFYNFEMLSHAFLSAGIAVYVNALLQAALSQGPSLYKTAMATKQAFVMLSEIPDNTRLWYYSWELPIFAVMGVLGGMLGAAMVALNNAVTRFRRRFIPPTKPARRVAEVLLLAALTATAWFLASYLSPCAHYPPKYLVINNQGNNTGLGDPLVLFGGYYPQLWCPEGHYSEFGMLFFMPQMTSITMLFQYQLPNGASFVYSVGALASLFMLGWLFMTLTFGIGAVTGLFVPSLLVGGAGGRLMGRLVRAVVLYMGYHKDDGTGVVNICLSAYAIVGAGSVLGGVSRMLLCNTVLVMETAAASTLIMPLIVTTFIAKAVADLLTPVGIFDLAIQRAGYPYLEAELTDLTDIKLQYALTAGDVMSSQLATLPALLPISELVEMLRRYPNFSTFPLTEPTAGIETGGAVCPDAALSAASNGPGEAAPSDGVRDTHNIGNAAVNASTPPARSPRSIGGPTGRDAAENASLEPPKVMATTIMPAAKCTGGAADAQQNSWGGPLAESAPLAESSSSTGAASEERHEAAEEGLREPLAAVTELEPAPPVPAPMPLPAPSGSWYPFQLPHYLQPRGGTSFLSAFAGGAAVAAAAAAAAAAAMPGALPAEMLRVMGWGGHGQGAGWRGGDQAERLQGAGPFGLRSASAPLPLPPPQHRPTAEQKLAAAGPSAALTSESKAVLCGGSETVGCSAESVGGGGGGHTAAAATSPPLVPPVDSFCQPAQARSDPGIIIGTISRSVLLKLLEMQMELRAMTQSGSSAAEDVNRTTDSEAGGNDVAGIPSWLTRRHTTMSRNRAAKLMDALDNYPVKAPRDREAEEALFVRLQPQDMATYLDLRHYMQRVPYIVPATASLARTYRLFRGLGLHHVFVTQPSVPIIGLITRTNIAPANAYKVAYDLAQMEQAQLQALMRQEPVEQEAHVRVGEGGAGGGGAGGACDGSGGDDGGKGIIDAAVPVAAQPQPGQQPKYQMAYRASFERSMRVLGRLEAAAAREGPSQSLQQPHRWSLGGTGDGGAASVPGDRNVHERGAGVTLSPGRQVFRLSNASDRVPAFRRQDPGEQLLPLPPSRRRTDPGIRPLALHHSGEDRNLRTSVGPALAPDEQEARVGWAMPDVPAGASVMGPAPGPRYSGQQQVSGEEAPAASLVVTGGGGGGGGVRSGPFPRQNLGYLRINLARNGRELDGGAGLTSGTNTPMGEGNVRDRRPASSAAESDVDRSDVVETGGRGPQLSHRGLRRRNPAQRSHYPGGTDLASTPVEPTRYDDTMCGPVWPIATPFSALVFGDSSGGGGSGGGNAPRRATTQAAWGSDVAAGALQGVRNPARWGQVGRVLSRVISNEPPDEREGASDGGGGSGNGDVEAPPQLPVFRPEDLGLQQTEDVPPGEDTTPRRIHTVFSEAVKTLIKTATLGLRAGTNSENPPVQQDTVALVSGEDQQREQGQIQRPPVLQRLQLQVSRKVRGGGAIADFVEPSVPAPAPPVETLLANTFLTSSPPPPPQPSTQAPVLPMLPRQLRREGATSLSPLSLAPPRGPRSDGNTLLPLPASRLQQAPCAIGGTGDIVAAGRDSQRSSGGSPGEGAPELKA